MADCSIISAKWSIRPFSISPEEPERGESEVASEKAENNSPNNSETIPISELFGGSEAAPQAEIVPFENVRHSGRLRKYEEVGVYGDLPVSEVVRFRAKYGRHIEGMSAEMQAEYDFWYFIPPNKRKDKDQYAKHVRAWDRRSKWLADLSTSGGDGLAAITDLSEVRKARGR